MRLPLRPLLNPLLQNRNLRRLQLLVLLGRRHDLVWIGRRDPLKQWAFLWMPLDHCRTAILPLAKESFLPIKPKPFFAGGGIGTVTMKTILPENRPHVAVENHPVFRPPSHLRKKDQRQRKREKTNHH